MISRNIWAVLKNRYNGQYMILQECKKKNQWNWSLDGGDMVCNWWLLIKFRKLEFIEMECVSIWVCGREHLGWEAQHPGL